MRTFQVGDTVYHERRYWKSDGLLPHERPGWNAEYVPYTVWKVTPGMLWLYDEATATITVSLPRRPRPKRPGHAPHTTLEADGKQYHSRFHEYFYAEIPEATPEAPPQPMSKYAHALLLLGIQPPYSDDDVSRAYKRKAREMHPDVGGSHHEFIRLQEARDVALRRY